MNIKKQAYKLEKFLEEELKYHPLIVILSDNSIAYKNFLIKKDSAERWGIKKVNGNVIESFNLKSSALIAANYYIKQNFRNFNEIKMLDQSYFKNSIDADRFKYRCNTTTDCNLRDVFTARYIEARDNAKIAKKKITGRFKMMF